MGKRNLNEKLISYCINPKCYHRENPISLEQCSTCGTALRIQNRYRLIRPLRPLDEHDHTEIFEVEENGHRKILKILKTPKFRYLFEREVSTLKQLQHPGIPKVEADGDFTLIINDKLTETSLPLYCFVMTKIQGQNLEGWIAENQPISQELAIDWLEQLVNILELLHHHTLFHRDIKLSNVMLQPDGRLVLIDFGSVRRVTNTYLLKIRGGEEVTGEVTGIVSPGYTSLEQINGKAVYQSDFYALGRSFVHLMTGKHPIDFPIHGSMGTLIWRSSAPQISSWLLDLVDDLMAPFPAKRPLNTEEILQRLKGDRYLPSKQLLFLCNLGLLILLLFLGWRLWQNYADWQNYEQQCSDRLKPQVNATGNLNDKGDALIVCPGEGESPEQR